MASPVDSPKTVWTPGSWHIPGPSSRYHKRQYSQPIVSRHTRFASSPEADDLLTLRRRPDRPQSPHRRVTSLARANTAPMEHDRPLTPVRSPLHTAHLPHDSPFSDYFTDEARSSSQKASYIMPSSEVQRMLLRLNDLGAHVLRQPPATDALESISQRLDELEQSIAGMDGSPVIRRDMIDSGSEDDDAGASCNGSPSKRRARVHSAAQPISQEQVEEGHHIDSVDDGSSAEEEEHKSTIRDRLLFKSQDVLERIVRTNQNLRQRFEQMRELNDMHAEQVEEAQLQVLQLRSENESLKADLGFDHSELLYLKLQLRALEVQAQGDVDSGSSISQQPKILLHEDVAQWKSAWEDVDARQRQRRSSHRVVSSTPLQTVRQREDGKDVEEQGDWKLQLSRKRVGRVQSITLRRYSDNDKETQAHVQPEPPEQQGAMEQLLAVNAEEGDNNPSADDERAKQSVPALARSTITTIISVPGEGLFSTAGRDSEPRDVMNLEDQEESNDVTSITTARHSAWTELVESLTAFAGMSDR